MPDPAAANPGPAHAGPTDPGPAHAGAVASALAPDLAFGLYPTATFRLADGRDTAGATIRQARWYFEHETIALPRPDVAVAGFAPGVTAREDVRAWARGQPGAAALEHPPLVWVAAPSIASHARLSSDARAITLADGATLPFALVPRIAANRSYFDAASARFFAARPTRVRGAVTGGTLVARTLWPEDFRLDPALPLQPLAAGPGPQQALRALIRGEPAGGAQSPFAARLLWQRAPGAPIPAGRAVLALILNGAQGDDDEAHGGHFALVTGRTRADGAIGDWLVDNFYSLDIESEKGILAAPLPLDNYVGDLNSGQGWYRPSYLVVAVLAEERAAALVQGALNRVYNQFYRHQLVYRHATMNCAGISVDVLRALGFPIPVRGAENALAGALGFPYFLATDRSLAKAKIASDYLIEDRPRLMPAVAFEDTAAGLLALAGEPGSARADPADGPLARMLAADIEAIAFLRLPQFPSSRAFGDAPVVTTREYRRRVPADPALRQIIPVPDRPFPDALRDPDLLPPPAAPSDRIALAWGLVAAAAIVALAWLCWRWVAMP